REAVDSEVGPELFARQGAADQDVIVAVPDDPIDAQPADHDVPAVAPHEQVGAGAAGEDVVAPAGAERVVAVAAVKFDGEADGARDGDRVVPAVAVDDDAADGGCDVGDSAV